MNRITVEIHFPSQWSWAQKARWIWDRYDLEDFQSDYWCLSPNVWILTLTTIPTFKENAPVQSKNLELAQAIMRQRIAAGNYLNDVKPKRQRPVKKLGKV